MKWRVEILNQTVLEELDALPPDMRAKLDHIVRISAVRLKVAPTDGKSIYRSMSYGDSLPGSRMAEIPVKRPQMAA